VEPGVKAIAAADIIRVKVMSMMVNRDLFANEAAETEGTTTEVPGNNEAVGANFAKILETRSLAARSAKDIGFGSAIIGGGCCVHLSIEYRPAQFVATSPALVAVTATDTEGTALMWGKVFSQGYHIKECIISTNPGANLYVITLNAIARVRWCEIFSC